MEFQNARQSVSLYIYIAEYIYIYIFIYFRPLSQSVLVGSDGEGCSGHKSLCKSTAQLKSLTSSLDLQVVPERLLNDPFHHNNGIANK